MDRLLCGANKVLAVRFSVAEISITTYQHIYWPFALL